MNNKITVSLLPTTNFLRNDGTFDLNTAIRTCGRIGGICYSPEDYEKLKGEDPKKTEKRVNLTLDSGHHSLYDHVQVSLNVCNMPKILAMVLNNEHQYTTSERLARYTKIDTSAVSTIEAELYNKWITILGVLIKQRYPDRFTPSKIEKLAMENARYFISIFVPTNLIYTVPLGQLNRIVGWLKDYLKWTEHPLCARLTPYIKEFIEQLKMLNLLEPRLQRNEKGRRLSLFATEEEKRRWEEHFSLSYSTNYYGSFALLAQAHRHRTLDYQIFIPHEFKVFVPTILFLFPEYMNLWLSDIEKVKELYPQGQLVKILEQGTLENFLLKSKERLCTNAMPEIMCRTIITLKKYCTVAQGELQSYLSQYLGKPRCAFPDYTCFKPCGYAHEVNLSRAI